MTEEPAHSPKGASSAERWMSCSGSAALLKQLSFPETDEPEWTALGTAAHSLASESLLMKVDTWESVGTKIGVDFIVDKNMADAVQIYLDHCRPLMEGREWLVEKRIGEDPAMRPHPDFYGTVDFSAHDAEWLDVVDYKHGEGIVVEPEDNEQGMYYAYGRLFEWRQIGRRIPPNVRITIVQPRAFHEDGPIRTWETTAERILQWGDNVLLPRMEAAEIENDFNAGSWCRFCPAKLFCPLLVGLFGAAAKADPNAVHHLSDQRLGLEYEQRAAVKFYMTALEAEIFRRNNTGNIVPGTKLVWKKAHRVWRDGAEITIKTRLGQEAYTLPELKSPAEIEKVSGDAKKLVKEWAYSPKTGLTVAPDTDKRQAVKVEKSTDTFAHFKPETTND